MKTLLHMLTVIVFLLTAACQEAGVPAANLTMPVQQLSTPKEIIPRTLSPSSALENNNDGGVNMPDLTKTPDPNAQNVVQIATNDLANKLQITVDQIRLASMEAVTWPDTSLGCPQMGMAYAQVLTSGYKLVLEANGKNYPYHTDDKDRVILCALRPGGEYFITPTP